MEGMNTTLYFWRRKKNQEVLMCFLGEKYGEKRERKNAQKTPKQLLNPPPHFLILVQYRVPWAMPYKAWRTFKGCGWAWRPNKVHQDNVIVTSTNSSYCTFWFQLWMHIWRSPRTPTKVIVVSLESYGCLVFRTLKKLNFQRLDQNL